MIADPVRVQSAEIRYVNIKDLLPERYRNERDWGGFSLSYEGFNREMWSQFRFLGVNGGTNVDEFFTVKSEARSSNFEAAWWTPEKSDAIIALGNITDADSSATITFGNGHSKTIKLKPHETDLVREGADAAGVNSVAVSVTGPAGSIIPTGLITAKDGSFNSVIRFYDPSAAKQSNLYGNGFRVTGQTEHMVLKNTTSSGIAVVPEFIPLTGVSPFVLSQVSLAPYETKEVDLTPLLTAARSRHDLDVTSVEVDNLSGPGSIIGSLYGISNATGVNYEIPLRDSGLVRTMTGSYPWKITDDFTTVAYITNISDQDAEFVGEVNYQGGHVALDPRKLHPGETAVFDLQKFRDEHTADSKGNVLLPNVSLGQFKWTISGVTNGKLLLIGRAEMVSRTQHISSSYSCNDPCPPYLWGSLDPFPPPTIIVAATAQASAWETATYDNGYSMGPYSVGASWSVDSSAISVNPTSAHTTTLTGDDPGDGCVTADMGSQERYSWDGQNCIDNNFTDPIGGSGCVEVNPTINDITPNLGPIDSSVGISIIGSGFGTNPSVSVGGGITTNIQDHSNTSISVTLNIPATASAGSHGITVTANRQQSNTVNFFVQIPTKLSRDSVSGLQDEQGGCGATRSLHYTLLDQDGDPIDTNGTIAEGITNQSSTAGVGCTASAPQQMAHGGISDTVGYAYSPGCPPPFTTTCTQNFVVTLTTSGYAWVLSSQNAISMGRTSSGSKFVDINFTQ